MRDLNKIPVGWGEIREGRLKKKKSGKRDLGHLVTYIKEDKKNYITKGQSKDLRKLQRRSKKAEKLKSEQCM